MDLSIIIPTLNEAANIPILIDKIRGILSSSSHSYEIIVVDANSKDGTLSIAQQLGTKAFVQQSPGYGGALHDAIKVAQGRYIITMDADWSHNPYIIKRLLFHSKTAHIVIASRYVKSGWANMPLLRRILSIILNRFASFVLSIPVRDISSGFRLYNADIFKEIDLKERDFNVLIEILMKAYMNGFNVLEVPFHYQPRAKGKSNAKMIAFGLVFLKTIVHMWRLRNTISSADYDDRAFYSKIPLQRYWQRQRYKIICGFVDYQKNILDVGCGTSKIIGALPQAIGLDINFNKLRYNLALGNHLVCGDIKNLCFKDSSFEEIICSEIIEHLEASDKIFKELNRVLRKGGTLILGTPDYSRISWNVIEWCYKKVAPGGYADTHITHYTRKDLVEKMRCFGFRLDRYKYVFGSELICRFLKIS